MTASDTAKKTRQPCHAVALHVDPCYQCMMRHARRCRLPPVVPIETKGSNGLWLQEREDGASRWLVEGGVVDAKTQQAVITDIVRVRALHVCG